VAISDVVSSGLSQFEGKFSVGISNVVSSGYIATVNLTSK